jgi:hypothetical protein
VSEVGGVEVFRLERDFIVGFNSKVVAVRWDLLPWGIVLDLDAPLGGEVSGPCSRIWLAFSGISSVTFPMEMARVPNGCYVDDELRVEPLPDGKMSFALGVLLPVFDDEERLEGHPSRAAIIIAQRAVVLRSLRSAAPTSMAGLAWSERQALAPDEQLVALLQSLEV